MNIISKLKLITGQILSVFDNSYFLIKEIGCFRLFLSCFFLLLLYPSFSQSGDYIKPNPAFSRVGMDKNDYITDTQNYITNIQHFGRKEGLSHRTVRYTYQDSRGFIWVGCRYGLNRFDGHRFEIFTKEKDGLPFNTFNFIIEDAEGWLWLFRDLEHSDGVNDIPIAFINIYTKEVKTFEARFGQDVPFIPREIFSVVKDRKGTLYFGSRDGLLIKFHPREGIKVIPFENGRWLELHNITEEGILIARNRFDRELAELVGIDTLGNRLWTIKNAKDYRFIGGANGGKKWCWEYDENRGSLGLKFFTLSTKDGKISPKTIVPDTEKIMFGGAISDMYYSQLGDYFWCKNNYRLFIFHPELGILYDFSLTNPEIINSTILKVYFDNRNNTWISTTSGLYKIQLKANPFKSYFSLPEADFNIKISFSARGLLVQEDYLWACSQSQERKYGLNLLTGEKLDLGFITREVGNGLNWTFILANVKALSETELLFGSGKCHLVYNKQNQHYKFIELAGGLINRNPWSFFEDQKGRYWSGLDRRGLSYWDRQNDIIVKYKQFNDFPEFRNSTVYAFLELDERNILLSTNRGIYLFHIEKGILDRFWEKGNAGHQFPNNNVHHIAKDKDNENVLWVATGGGGLIRWTIDKEQLTREIQTRDSVPQSDGTASKAHRQFTIVDGLSSNVIYAVYEDENQNLWLPSEEGLIRFNKNTFHSKAFTVEDGITHNEFNRISHFEAEDGTFYFGGLNGITAFHPNDLIVGEDVENIPLQITRFQQFDGELNQIVDRTGEIVQNHSITIQPRDKFFSIDLALLEYADNSSIRYAYKIDTQNEDWIYLNDNSLRISGLPYGNHILQIKGQASSSQFSKQELTIPILVKKPFYLQTWFILSVLIALIGSLIFWYRQRTKEMRERQAKLEQAVNDATVTIRQQNEELKNLDKVKSRFFANVSHELRTPIALILGPLKSMLKSKQLNSKNAHFAALGVKNAKGLLNLVTEILDLTKMESGKVELKEDAVALYDLLKILISAFDGMAEQKGIDYQFVYKADKNLHLNLDVKKVQKLINNLLSNAFKFTPSSGKITLSVMEKEDNIHLSVADSGRGIHSNDLPHVFDRFYQSSQPDAPREGGTGIGLSLCMEFAKLMNAKLWVESDLGTGSTFYFEFPRRIASPELQVAEQIWNDEPIQETLSNEKEEIQPATSNPQLATSNPQPVTNPQPATILLVEDNDNLRDYIEVILSEHYEIKTAENGKVAWNLLNRQSSVFSQQSSQDGKQVIAEKSINIQDNKEEVDKSTKLIEDFGLKTVDLIISDIMMPEMDGYQLLEKLKDSDHFRGTPVIMLTALADLKDKLKALRIGVDDYMTKPFEEEELLARISNLLRNSRERKAFYLQENSADPDNAAPRPKAAEIKEPESQNSEQGKGPNSQTNNFTKEDSQWLAAVEDKALEKIGNFDFTMDHLAFELSSNRWTIYRRIKQLTGLTATQYLKEIRLIHARHLLEQNLSNSVKALAYDVGMKDVKYFSRQFKERFGKLPSEYF